MWIKLLLNGIWTVLAKLYVHLRTIYWRYRAEFAEMLAEHRRQRNETIETSQHTETRIEAAMDNYAEAVPTDDKSRLDATVAHKPNYGDE